MNLSGILVVVPPGYLDATMVALASLPGVEVHHHDAASGRIIVTQEGNSVDAEVEGLKRIKALPRVLVAEMVYHYFEDDTGIGIVERRQPPSVPPYLDD
jgi:nitrate reductase NapD